MSANSNSDSPTRVFGRYSRGWKWKSRRSRRSRWRRKWTKRTRTRRRRRRSFGHEMEVGLVGRKFWYIVLGMCSSYVLYHWAISSLLAVCLMVKTDWGSSDSQAHGGKVSRTKNKNHSPQCSVSGNRSHCHSSAGRQVRLHWEKKRWQSRKIWGAWCWRAEVFW